MSMSETTVMSKLANPSDAEAARNIRAKIGKTERIAFVSGNFNVVHPGHMRLLKFAAEQCDFLVVGVNPDWAAGVAVPLDLRLEGLESISLVDRVVQLSSAPEHFIALLQPDLVIKGKEFEGIENPEDAATALYGGKLVFSSGEMRFSSLDMLRREYFETNFSTIRKPLEYPTRHNFDVLGLRRILPKLTGLRVLVIGDLIVDEYITCDPIGMSQEDPTIVVTPLDSKTFVGGAGVVSAHARGLGADVCYCTVVGADEAAEFALQSLSEYGVTAEAFVDDSRPTTRKQRFRANNKTLLRVNHLRQHPISSDVAEQMLVAISRQLPTTDLLLFSDFNYGCLPQELVDAVIEQASARGIMMAADSQASSQRADISRFKGMALITPTEREARLALNDFDSGLAAVSERLHDAARAATVVVTLGSEGVLVSGSRNGELFTDRLPAFNTMPRDVAGAGDSLFTSVSLALCAGIDIWQGIYFGSLAAACQVSRVGNAPLTALDLLTEINSPMDDFAHRAQFSKGAGR
jgi:rfaE bifunctional protein kinase chain/domain